MLSDLVIRRPQASEYGSVQILIETVASETFKDIFAAESRATGVQR